MRLLICLLCIAALAGRASPSTGAILLTLNNGTRHSPSDERTDIQKKAGDIYHDVQKKTGDIYHVLSSAFKHSQSPWTFSWPHWSIVSRPFWQCGLHWLRVILAGAALGLLLIPAFFLGLALLGFTMGGVAAGSLAACCQRHLAEVAAGGAFATAQSFAQLGILAACTPPVLIGTSSAGVAVASYHMYMLHCSWFSAVCCQDDWQWWTTATGAL